MKPIFLSPPWVGDLERQRVTQAFDSGYVAPCGPFVDCFEAKLKALSGCSIAAVSSGTSALELILQELNVGADTTVIASDLTFIATIGPAIHRGARPVFVDTDPETGTISLPLLQQALRETRGRKVIISADIYGQCADYANLEKLAAVYEVPLVIDAAEAVGATSKGRQAGTAGVAGVYSFNGNKLITTSGGGAVLSRDDALVARARWRAQQARENHPWYEHREVGYNHRLSNILAAVGCAQLERLSEIICRKRNCFNFWRTRLTDAQAYPCLNEEESTHWLSVFLLKSTAARDALAKRLAQAQAETRPVWKPMHLQPVFTGAKTYGGGVSEDFFARGICLPSGAGLDSEDFCRLEACI